MRLVFRVNINHSSQMIAKFLLSDSEAELLIHFETALNLEDLASRLNRDVTVISRQLKRISEKADVLTKISGRWVLTKKGRCFNQLTQDYLRSQVRLFTQKSLLRIGTNREFASRVIAPRILELRAQFKNTELELRVYENGAEQALLLGEVDLAFDCGRAISPEIKYTQLIAEPILAVASPKFIAKYGVSTKLSELSEKSHVYCGRLKPDRVALKHWDVSEIAIQTNDIASARAMAVQGMGWALLPKYAIEPELKRGELKTILNHRFDQEKYGVWYLRARQHLKTEFEHACQWLSGIEL